MQRKCVAAFSFLGFFAFSAFLAAFSCILVFGFGLVLYHLGYIWYSSELLMFKPELHCSNLNQQRFGRVM